MSTHATFTLGIGLDTTPERVFTAFSDPAMKKQWFGGGEHWQQTERELDFRIGGHELLSGTWANGTHTTFEAYYHDIVKNERIVHSYTMHLNKRLISVSLATTELTRRGNGSVVRYTEQIVYLNGFEDPSGEGRRSGSIALFDRLETLLLAPV